MGRASNFIDMSGKTYGDLKVLSLCEVINKRTMWLCECKCGKLFVTDGWRIRSGKTKSCGCLSRELSIKRSTKHGMSKDRIYHIHRAILARCYNKNTAEYHNYGGRGIIVCDEWIGKQGFENFLKWSLENGYNEKLSIDRIDVNGNYEPQNCRWATQKEQGNNTRKNVRINYCGETHTVTEWAEIMNMPYKRLHKRIRSGWDISRALNTPKMKNQFY